MMGPCEHETRGGEQFCIFCLRKIGDDLEAKVDRALALVEIYERGDEPEGAPSASRTLRGVAEILRSAP